MTNLMNIKRRTINVTPIKAFVAVMISFIVCEIILRVELCTIGDIIINDVVFASFDVIDLSTMFRITLAANRCVDAYCITMFVFMVFTNEHVIKSIETVAKKFQKVRA